MKTIVWDVDDVLNGLMQAWFQTAWRAESPESAVEYDRITENPPHRVLGISLEDYLRSIDEFRRERGAHLEPDREVLAWFEQHGHRYRHVALTAVPLQAAGTWAAWVTGHFGRWIRSFNFIPSHRPGEDLPVFEQTKAEFLGRWARVDALVEDNPTNLEAARALGIRAVTVPQPWNGARGTLADALRQLADL